jgi:uncharacterized protein (UPF0264 family)
MAELLVSVRSVAEAQAALEGGACIIDVKDPFIGSLGRASPSTIAGVVGLVAGRVPVSAALGELGDLCETTENLKSQFVTDLPEGLNYVKWGLAGNRVTWRRKLVNAAMRLTACPSALTPSPVAVAYADWQHAQAPPPEQVWEFVRDHDWPVFLLDTWMKNGRTLLDWLSLNKLLWLRQQCHRYGIRLALAGSLGVDQIRELLPLHPDIFAVRGAVCRQNDRTGYVETSRVRYLVELLASSKPGARAKTPVRRHIVQASSLAGIVLRQTPTPKIERLDD